MFRLHMDGDFGQDRMVFTTLPNVREWAEKAYAEQMGQNPEEPFEEYWQGACSTELLEVC